MLMHEQIKSRYPRLLRAIRFAGGLTENEALSAIHAHKYVERDSFGACEAVMFACGGGSTSKLMVKAWQKRHQERAYRQYLAYQEPLPL